MTTTNNKPWNNSNGTRKSDSEIKLICQFWSASTWDRFLKETTEKSCIEKLADNSRSFETSSEYIQISSLFSETTFEDHEYFRPFIRAAMKRLTSRQYLILKMIFWENKTEYEVSKILNIARGAVNCSKNRALQKLKDGIISEALKQEVEPPKLVA